MRLQKQLDPNCTMGRQKCTFFALRKTSDLGTIHILRKHFEGGRGWGLENCYD